MRYKKCTVIYQRKHLFIYVMNSLHIFNWGYKLGMDVSNLNSFSYSGVLGM